MQREGIFREMKLRGHYEKPSEKRARERAEATRRARKLARKRAQREGLLPSKPKPALRIGAPRCPSTAVPIRTAEFHRTDGGPYRRIYRTFRAGSDAALASPNVLARNSWTACIAP